MLWRTRVVRVAAAAGTTAAAIVIGASPASAGLYPNPGCVNVGSSCVMIYFGQASVGGAQVFQWRLDAYYWPPIPASTNLNVDGYIYDVTHGSYTDVWDIPLKQCAGSSACANVSSAADEPPVCETGTYSLVANAWQGPPAKTPPFAEAEEQIGATATGNVHGPGVTVPFGNIIGPINP
jgi:hypothetical protein